MQTTYQPPLLLQLNYSKRLIAVMGFIHALALAACVMNSLPIIIKCALLITVCASFYCQLKRLKNQRYTIKYTETLGWEMSEDGEFEAIQILPSTVISIVALFLQVKKDNKPMQTLLIPSDALAEDDYRRLIVKLKTSGVTVV